MLAGIGPAAATPSKSPLPDLGALLADQPGAHVSRRTPGAGPALVTGLSVTAEGADPATRARSFLATWGEALGLRGVALSAPETTLSAGRQSVRFGLEIQGLPVFGHVVVVKLDGDRVLSVAAGVPSVGAVDSGRLDAAAATDVAHRAVDGATLSNAAAPRLGFALMRGRAVQCWRVIVASATTPDVWSVLVSSTDGRVLRRTVEIKR